MVQTMAQKAGMIESLEAIKLKGLKIISLSSILALQLPGFFGCALSAMTKISFEVPE